MASSVRVADVLLGRWTISGSGCGDQAWTVWQEGFTVASWTLQAPSHKGLPSHCKLPAGWEEVDIIPGWKERMVDSVCRSTWCADISTRSLLGKSGTDWKPEHLTVTSPGVLYIESDPYLPNRGFSGCVFLLECCDFRELISDRSLLV